MSNILQELEQEIANVTSGVAKTNVGTVREIGDGVAKVEGLSDVQLNEMIEFPGNLLGLALNLEEGEVGVVMLGDSKHIAEGDECHTTGRLLSVPVGEGLLGRVVDALGRPVDGKGEVSSETEYPVEKIAPGIIKRKSVSVPVQTGIAAIDAMIPIGRGQRELIIGDRSTGKTTIAVDTIIAQAQQNKAAKEGRLKDHKPLYCVYVAIGQKQSNIARTISTLEKAEALDNTIIVAAAASDSATNQFLAPYAGCAMAEYLMDQGKDVLIVYDDLSKQAVAYRQVSLVLRRPSGREAYPGDVFYLHSRLLERSARLSDAEGGGSITALPIIETQAGDVSAYIPTNVISITDGQIFLEADMFNAGVRPAMNAGISVSRVGGAAQTKIVKKLSGGIRTALAQYRELAAFSQFASDLDDATKAQLEHGERITELMKQKQYAPLSIAEMGVLLYAGNEGYLQDVEVAKIGDFESALLGYMRSQCADVMQAIEADGGWDDDREAAFKSAIETFKSTQTW